MIPIGDSLRSRSVPYVNYGLILVNALVWIYELSLQAQRVRIGNAVGTELDRWTIAWGMVPCRLTDSCTGLNGLIIERLSGGSSDWLHLITSQFIHGGWLHILGNMLFLWIFGDNVEDAMGHGRYLLFYLLGGVLAALAHVAAGPTSAIPTVGASGAIAAVLGAYLATYPRASVSVVIPIIIIPWMTRVPAVIMMGLWFVSQLIGIGSVSNAMGGEGGVAYWAHIGGFIAGLVLVWFFRGRKRSWDEQDRYRAQRW